nr:retrovirus-related Pol polyprotein from transposon TNT 1-94 [Tanacetum cinerariifolium]
EFAIWSGYFEARRRARDTRVLHKMTEAKGDGGEGLYVRPDLVKRDVEQLRQSHRKEAADSGFVRNEDQVSDSGADGYGSADVMMAMSVKELECCIRGTCKVQVQMRDGSSFVLDNVMYVLEIRQNLISLGTLEKEEVYTTMYEEWVAKHLDVAGIQQQNGLVEETNTTLLAKVCCFLIQSGLSKVFWAEDTTMSTYLVNRSPSSSIGFKAPVDMLGFSGWLASIKQGMLEPIKVKCIFLGYHEVAAVDKIYAHESLTFNNTVACEGRSILSLEGSLSGDRDVEKNDKWSCIYAVGSQEYQMVGLDITSADVGMLDKFDRGLQTDVHVFVDFYYAMGRSITVIGFMDPSHSSSLSSVSQNSVSSDVVDESCVPSGSSLSAFTEEIVAYETENDETHPVKRYARLKKKKKIDRRRR